MGATNNRATKINKLYQALKKHYKPVTAPERPLMETLLYACLLEDAPYEAADEGLARLEQDYFDWNEVRVTTVTELRDVLRGIPDPTAAALRLKKNLHSLFETHYTFDLEELKKQNLGKAIESLEKLPAITPFVLGFVVQHCLGGHLIAVDRCAMRLLHACDIVTAGEAEKGKTPGLERAVPKAKGLEFTSLLHQASVALLQNPKDKQIWAMLKTVHPEATPPSDEKIAADAKKSKKPEPAKPAEEKKVTADKKTVPEKKGDEKKHEEKKHDEKKVEAKKAGDEKTVVTEKKPAGDKRVADKVTPEAKPAAKKDVAAEKKPVVTPDKKAVPDKSEKKPAAGAEKKLPDKPASTEHKVEKKADDKKPLEKKVEVKKAEEKKAEDKKPAAKPAADKQKVEPEPPKKPVVGKPTPPKAPEKKPLTASKPLSKQLTKRKPK